MAAWLQRGARCWRAPAPVATLDWTCMAATSAAATHCAGLAWRRTTAHPGRGPPPVRLDWHWVLAQARRCRPGLQRAPAPWRASSPTRCHLLPPRCWHLRCGWHRGGLLGLRVCTGRPQCSRGLAPGADTAPASTSLGPVLVAVPLAGAMADTDAKIVVGTDAIGDAATSSAAEEIDGTARVIGFAGVVGVIASPIHRCRPASG